MINLILNRNKISINLQSITIHNPNSTTITDPKTILTLIQHHFKIQTNNQNIPNIQDFPDWFQEYSPKTNIHRLWYIDILRDIISTEITTTIQKMNSESAPGKSGINYTIYKHISPKARTLLAIIFTKILTTSEIPNKWQQNLIYPIPKKYNWENNLNLTRPRNWKKNLH